MKKRSIGILLSYGYTFLNMACSLAMSSFLLRGLGDTEYGLYQTISAFASYLVMLEVGTGTVISRNVALCRGRGENEKIKNNTSTIWYVTVFLSFIILLASIVFAMNIGNIYAKTMTPDQVVYGQKIFAVITGYLIVSFLTNNLNGFLLGMEEYTFASIIKIFKLLVRTISLVIIISFHSYAIWIALIDLIVSLAVFIVTYIFCRRRHDIKLKLKYFDKEILRECLPLCLALLLQAVINQANNSVDKFVIGIQMSLESVALYSVVQYIYSLIATIGTIPISIYMPQIAKDVASGKAGKELTKTLVPACRLVALICGTLFFGFIAVGKQFVGIFYGTSRQDAWLYALISCSPMVVNMTNGVIVNILDVLNKRLIRSLALMGTTVMNIILTVLLIQDYGILGAVIGTAASLILGNIIIMNIYYSRSIKLNVIWLFGQAYKGILLSQIIASVLGFIAASFIENIYLSFLVGGCLYVVILAILLLIWGFNQGEKQKVFSILKKAKILRK